MKTQNEYPLVMKANHIAEAMGISKRMAYNVMELPDFPVIKVSTMKMVARDSFFEWLNRAGKAVR